MTKSVTNENKSKPFIKEIWGDILNLCDKQLGWHRLWAVPVAAVALIFVLALVFFLWLFSEILKALNIVGVKLLEGMGLGLGVMIILELFLHLSRYV